MDRFARQILNLLQGSGNAVLTIYPVQNYAAGAGALVAGATMTVAAGAWPAYVNIIAGAAITREFYITQVQIDTPTLACTIDLQIFNATIAATILECKFDCTAVSANLTPFTPPFPIYCPPNSQIQGRIGGTAGKTCNVSVLVATGI